MNHFVCLTIEDNGNSGNGDAGGVVRLETEYMCLLSINQQRRSGFVSNGNCFPSIINSCQILVRLLNLFFMMAGKMSLSKQSETLQLFIIIRYDMLLVEIFMLLKLSYGAKKMK